MSHDPRQPVPLPQAYRLLNHGPTVLVSAAHGGRRNVMAAAWAMPLDFDPPKVAVVIDKSTATRALIEGSGRFVLNLPCRASADLAYTVGSESAHEVGDKFERHGIATFDPADGDAPLLQGCVAWLACRVMPEEHNEKRYDLFIGEVTAAWADTRVFTNGRWHFAPEHEALRTLHHVAGGAFFSPADLMQASLLAPLKR
jgi:flavin reductase (DIM6/NTAB) family NADH-FMN oxidoreductase RutF